ncbi:hypothetical protein Syun_028069 [Stephania yunnanensis]|uniref:Uncharacterized protein n=1 Tax=Stephania yunnanensis TaxID=152371 RepID=A0AAP0ENZ8_9MAGN
MEAATRPSSLPSPSARDWSLQSPPRVPSPHPKPEDYKKAVEKARKKIRALISVKQCALLMLQLMTLCWDIRYEDKDWRSVRYDEACIRASSWSQQRLAGVVAVEVAGGPKIPFHPGRESAKLAKEPKKEGLNQYLLYGLVFGQSDW